MKLHTSLFSWKALLYFFLCAPVFLPQIGLGQLANREENPIFIEKNQESSARFQVSYQLSPQKDIPLLATGFALTVAGRYFQALPLPYTNTQIQNLSSSNVSSFDQVSIKYWSPTVARISDGLMGLAMVSPLVHLAGKAGRSQWKEIAVMGLEAAMLNEGLTGLAKGIFLRPRPYLFNPEAPLEKKKEKDARFSFWSGHSSWSACLSVFSAKVFQDLYPESKWKPLVFTAAALIPLATGYCRVRAGKHYPTDVLTGLGVGAIIGWWVPQMHRKYKKGNLTFYPTGGGTKGMGMVWAF